MQTMFASGETGREGSDLAFTDPLTGLGNHRRFYDKVTRLINDRAEDPAPFAVGILDLDGFKPINDLFGHKAGDDILVQVAMRLRAAMDGHQPSPASAPTNSPSSIRWCSARRPRRTGRDADRDHFGAL